MGGKSQTYKYTKAGSIIGHNPDDYSLTQNEYYRIYSFYVTYCMCENLSAKKKQFINYGWRSNNINGTDSTDLREALTDVLDLVKRKTKFVFTEKDELEDLFTEYDLEDGALTDLDNERFVIGKTPGDNKYLRLFYRLRNGFAHGLFDLRYSSRNEKMVVIEDHNSSNVNARIVLKLDTLIWFINAVDRRGII